MSSQVANKIESLIQMLDEYTPSLITTTKSQKQSTSKLDDDEKKEESKPKSRILIADKLGLFVMETLNKSCSVISDPSLSGDTLLEQMKKFQPNIIVVRSTRVQKEHLNSTPSLALVIRAGAGVNTIDVAEASNKGIFVANCPGKNAIAVAELAMGHLVNMDRRIADNVAQLREGKWNKKEFGKSRGLFGRTIAVVGIGNIGKEVIKRALAFGMKVKGFSRSLTADDANKMGIIHCKTIQEACKDADALTLHLPHNDKTHYMINKELLSLLKDGAYVVNASRGGVVCEKDVLEVIKAKNIRYGPDVYENEPKATAKEYTNKDVYSNPNVYGTHHIGASSAQAEEAVGSEVLKIIQHFLRSGAVVNCVNLEKHTPAQYSLSIRHQDVVGVLAEILDILKADNVNVQEMRNIVFRGAKSACATLQVDQKPSENAMSKIRKNSHVYGVEVSAK